MSFLCTSSSSWRNLISACWCWCLCCSGLKIYSVEGQEVPIPYGADISWPMKHHRVSDNYAWLPHNVDPRLPVPERYQNMPIQPLPNVQERYNQTIEECVKFYGGKGHACHPQEERRIDMNLHQPPSMRNYTSHGYTKIRAPEAVYKLLKAFWNVNKNKPRREYFNPGYSIVNSWNLTADFVSVQDATLTGGGEALKQHIWNAARDTIQEWTGQQLVESSLYGIRVYRRGAILPPHVDRLPLVASAIINVDQDVDEPWPLEVIGHDGIAVNVTMEPGDMVLYESHSIIHGRPFPLNGKYMANVFIHFEPVGPIGGPSEYNGDLPPYVIPGSPWEEKWRTLNPRGHKLIGPYDFSTGKTPAHDFARAGDIDKLRDVLDESPHMISMRNEGGFMPLHEAVRKGHLDVIRLLLERGSDVQARTGSKKNGQSALTMALKLYGREHEITQMLVNALTNE